MMSELESYKSNHVLLLACTAVLTSAAAGKHRVEPAIGYEIVIFNPYTSFLTEAMDWKGAQRGTVGVRGRCSELHRSCHLHVVCWRHYIVLHDEVSCMCAVRDRSIDVHGQTLRSKGCYRPDDNRLRNRSAYDVKLDIDIGLIFRSAEHLRGADPASYRTARLRHGRRPWFRLRSHLQYGTLTAHR